MRAPLRRPQTNSSPRKSEEQMHYENIASFFKWCIGIAGGAIAIIVSFAIYSTYNNVKDMKDDYARTIKDLKEEINDLKIDAESTVKSIENDAKETVRTTQANTDKTLQQIKSSTSQFALDETRKELSDIFGTNKIQDLIENEAVREVKDKVEEIVQEETKNLSRINDAASYMRLGSRKGLTELKNYFEHPTNKLDSLTAKNLYDEIRKNYIEVRAEDTTQWSSNNSTKLTFIDETQPLSEANKSALSILMGWVNESNSELNNPAGIILYINNYVKHPFDVFDVDGLKKGYSSLKK